MSAPSPFIAGTTLQYAWDSTSLGWLKTCPRLYQYHMIEGRRAKGESVHLKFGLLYHAGLEMYDKLCAAGSSHDEALDAVVQWAMEETWEREECKTCGGSGFTGPHNYDGVCSNCGGQKFEGPGSPWESNHNLKTRETLVRSLIWYIEHFHNDPAKTVILPSGKPAVELSFRLEIDMETPGSYGQDNLFKPSGQPYLICGHLDRVVDFAGGTYVMDRKTSSVTISNQYFDQYSPDNQMSLYTFAAKVIYQTPVKGVIIDAAQIAVGFTRFSRGFTYRTDADIEEWLAETKWWIGQAEVYARDGYYPRNDKACHHFGGCTFRKICSKSPEVRERFLNSEFKVEPWNPLAVR